MDDFSDKMELLYLKLMSYQSWPQKSLSPPPLRRSKD